MLNCPCCGADLTVTLTSPKPALPPAPAEQWLEPCLLADRLGLSEPHVRRLINRGIKLDLAGCERRGGRLFATVEALEAMRV